MDGVEGFAMDPEDGIRTTNGVRQQQDRKKTILTALLALALLGFSIMIAFYGLSSLSAFVKG